MSILSALTAPQRLTAALCAALAATGGVFAWQTDFGRALTGGNVAVAARGKGEESKLLPMFALPAIDPTYKETIERPLFVPTRRQSPPGNSAPAETMKKGQYKLAGTLVNAETSTVFLLEQATNKTHRVALGAMIGPIKVERIAATSVTLSQGDDREELTLRTSASPKPPPPPAPGQPGAPGVPGAPGQPNVPGFPVGANVLQPGMAAGAAPGTPGGPPLPAGIPGVVAGVPTSGGFPMNSPITGQPVAGAPGIGTNPQQTAPTATDANGQPIRRRRFQNLPQ